MGTEKRFTLSGDFNIKKAALFAFALLVTLVIWNLPVSCFGIEGLNVIQQRIIAVFAFATILWVTGSHFALGDISVAFIGRCCFSTSDNAFTFLVGHGQERTARPQRTHGNLCRPHHHSVPLAVSSSCHSSDKVGTDVLLARTLLKPFGKKSENVLLGHPYHGFFSMFVSNTATAAMMLTFLHTGVQGPPPAEGKGRIALTLSIPVAANIGGMGTPIGTPPNAIALKYLELADRTEPRPRLRRLDDVHASPHHRAAPHRMVPAQEVLPVQEEDHRPQH